MADSPTLDDMIEAHVRQAMRRVEGLCPPEVEEEIRRMLRVALDTDPEMQRLLRASVARPSMRESDKVDVRALRAERPEHGPARKGGELRRRR
ncbi:uncharacterized protein SOCEGT47_011610 [Sorangium cellulosum]|uniref:Uncharacterized protein n=1 Tax=Sorangium cellulosum TaxID=56 RepID=A0A4P2PVZ3_SORCE|nr:hypothetical protein [Sorangium cellulosum]AUX20688.1 uncharacterized protein SOCEGT47_011610 [Sorangium cellulosum]